MEGIFIETHGGARYTEYSDRIRIVHRIQVDLKKKTFFPSPFPCCCFAITNTLD